MATFQPLDIPAGSGFGAALDVSAIGTQKCFVATLPNPQEIVLIQGSNDGVNYFSIGRLGFGAAPLDVKMALNFVRVRRIQAGPLAPSVAIGGEAVTGSTFGSVNVPAGNGSGVVLDSSAFGQVKTLSTGGTCHSGFMLIEASQDGVNFESIGQFRAPWGPDRQQTFTVECEYSRLRVTRFLALPSDTPSIQYGEGKDTAGGSGFAPDNASFWTRTAEGGLTNESAMDAIGDGIVLTTGGVPSIAQPGVDYVFPEGVSGGQHIYGGDVVGETLVLRANAASNDIIINDQGIAFTNDGNEGAPILYRDGTPSGIFWDSGLVAISNNLGTAARFLDEALEIDQRIRTFNSSPAPTFFWNGAGIDIEFQGDGTGVIRFEENGGNGSVNARFFADFTDAVNTYMEFLGASQWQLVGAGAVVGLFVDIPNDIVAVQNTLVGLNDQTTGFVFPGAGQIEIHISNQQVGRFDAVGASGLSGRLCITRLANFDDVDSDFIDFADNGIIEFTGGTTLAMRIDPLSDRVEVLSLVGLNDQDTGWRWDTPDAIDGLLGNTTLFRFDVVAGAGNLAIGSLAGFSFPNAQIAFIADTEIQIALSGVQFATFGTGIGTGGLAIEQIATHVVQTGDVSNTDGDTRIVLGPTLIEFYTPGNDLVIRIGGAVGNPIMGVFGNVPVSQQAAIPDAAGGVVVDIEARAVLNAWLAAERLYGWLDT